MGLQGSSKAVSLNLEVISIMTGLNRLSDIFIILSSLGRDYEEIESDDVMGDKFVIII